jgi:uncharacterized lipoprotein YehR (DUF1307 family)
MGGKTITDLKKAQKIIRELPGMNELIDYQEQRNIENNTIRVLRKWKKKNTKTN